MNHRGLARSRQAADACHQFAHRANLRRNCAVRNPQPLKLQAARHCTLRLVTNHQLVQLMDLQRRFANSAAACPAPRLNPRAPPTGQPAHLNPVRVGNSYRTIHQLSINSPAPSLLKKFLSQSLKAKPGRQPRGCRAIKRALLHHQQIECQPKHHHIQHHYQNAKHVDG